MKTSLLLHFLVRTIAHPERVVGILETKPRLGHILTTNIHTR